MTDIRVRACSICNEVFTSPRVPGRPPEMCSDECRRAAQNIHRRNYVLRHFGGLQAA
jgi:hypothetical protein